MSSTVGAITQGARQPHLLPKSMERLIIADNIQAALQGALPPHLDRYTANFAYLLASAFVGAYSEDEAQRYLVANPIYIEILLSLSEKTYKVEDKTIFLRFRKCWQLMCVIIVINQKSISLKAWMPQESQHCSVVISQTQRVGALLLLNRILAVICLAITLSVVLIAFTNADAVIAAIDMIVLFMIHLFGDIRSFGERIWFTRLWVTIILVALALIGCGVDFYLLF